MSEQHNSLPPPLQRYRGRVSELAQRIRRTRDVSAIIGMLEEALAATHSLTAEEELAAARRRVETAEESIRALKGELEQVKALLHRDPLTGCLNRRGIAEAYRRERARASRNRSALCLALIDLDDFKQLNDTHGHSAGDDALAAVAQALHLCLRPHDVIGRYGGEEFLVLLPATALRRGECVIERIRQSLAGQRFPCGDKNLQLTFSAGVAQHVAGEDMESLLRRADAALYRAKREGKNRVALAA